MLCDVISAMAEFRVRVFHSRLPLDPTISGVEAWYIYIYLCKYIYIYLRKYIYMVQLRYMPLRGVSFSCCMTSLARWWQSSRLAASCMPRRCLLLTDVL
jgi:hypothetical protein